MYNLKKAGMRSKNSCECSKKLLRALLLSTLFAVPSQFASAQLNIALSNAQLGTMIKQIQSQSQYQFFYDDDLADTPISSVNVKDASVEEVLNTALAGKGISYRVDENVVYLFKAYYFSFRFVNIIKSCTTADQNSNRTNHRCERRTINRCNSY